MAQFAKLDANNTVVDIIQIDDSKLYNEIEQKNNEIIGASFCARIFGGIWKETSSDIRVRLAKIGYSYNPGLDAFIPHQPYPSWILNNQIANWESPLPKPTEEEIKEQESNGFILIWDESSSSWEFVDTKTLTEEKIQKINYYTSIQQ